MLINKKIKNNYLFILFILICVIHCNFFCRIYSLCPYSSTVRIRLISPRYSMSSDYLNVLIFLIFISKNFTILISNK